MTGVSERPHRRRPLARYAVPAACGALGLGLLVAATLLHGADAAAVRGMPALGSAAWWWAGALVTAQVAALGVRPRATPAVLLAVGAAVPAFAVLGEGVGVGLFAVMVATFEVAVDGPRRRAAPALVTVAVLVAAGVTLSELRIGTPVPGALLGGALQALGTVGLPVLAAAVVGSRREARAARADSVAARGREHDARVQVAVERERTAMARELHDIAAHHLSGIAVMTGAIGRQIDVDPAGAKIAVAQVREQSTAMLRDLRNLVVLLRDTDAPDDADGTVRMETLAGVTELVARARESGVDVSLERAGPVEELATTGAVGPLAQLVVYRTVQEALANAARHAPGAPCHVLLDARDGVALVVTVRNDASPAPAAGPAHEPGYGLVGMRERAEVTGATLRYGPRAAGGWEVRLVVPAADRTSTGGATP